MPIGVGGLCGFAAIEDDLSDRVVLLCWYCGRWRRWRG